YQRLVLATGARERFLPFPGWTLPHVMGAGGIQAMVKSGMPIASKRVVVVGSGPLLIAGATYLRKCGAEIAVVAAQAPWRGLMEVALALPPNKRLHAWAPGWSLRGIPCRAGCWPPPAESGAVTLRPANRPWSEPCDYLGCGLGLVPNIELPALLGCTLQAGF